MQDFPDVDANPQSGGTYLLFGNFSQKLREIENS